jgi:hypothetical protein
MSSTVPPRPFTVPTPASKPRSHQVPPEVREAIWQRCGGLCELCKESLKPGWHAHHRRRRSQGGDDSVTNVLALHGRCHDRVHGHVDWSEQAGFLVRSTEYPGRKRLALFGERWVRLARDGSYVEAA